ncbi:MAG: chitobiase/beta-hexosaminidase C-terminal domain-containing protein, partial [Bacteroidales bacterium]|nr:chitobiase/beta-hexosaminidase C-terminal domain-containing protein [Bacteroidales bacterium]
MNANLVWSLSSNANGIATVNAATGVVTVTALPTSDVVITLTATASATGATTQTKTKNITVYAPPAQPTINFNFSTSTVTITSTTSGATIRYTMDGSDPSCTQGNQLTNGGSFTIDGAYTIKAIACAHDIASPVASQIVATAVQDPTISYSNNVITLATTTPGATIRYTTDGTTPTCTSGSTYSAPLVISSATSIKAIACRNELYSNVVSGGPYTPTAEAPTLSFNSTTNTLSMSTVSAGATIIYTTDGSTPTCSSGTEYNSPIDIQAVTNIKAITCVGSSLSSTVATGTFTPVIETPTITFDGAMNMLSMACVTEGTTIRYTTDGTSPTCSTGTEYTGTFEATTTGTVKAIACRNGVASDEATYTITALYLDAPVVSIDPATGIATVSHPRSDVVLHYTTDGSDPTASSPTVANGGTIDVSTYNAVAVKVLAARVGSSAVSAVASAIYGQHGVAGNVVTVYDYEDHNWTYYAGVDPTVDEGNYNTNYLNIMYSPDPRNVKITYQGGSVSGGSAVAISADAGENQNTMIYYKTIEKTQIGETGNYAYHVIPNPFSKRPKAGNTYYGFAGWKVISGGEYISEYNNNDVMPLEPTIHFTNLNNNYTPNCTSAEIVLEATWT